MEKAHINEIFVEFDQPFYFVNFNKFIINKIEGILCILFVENPV